jgi:hypothetical protein
MARALESATKLRPQYRPYSPNGHRGSRSHAPYASRVNNGRHGIEKGLRSKHGAA